MAARGFGFRTLTGTAQPVFGTTLATAINPSPDPHTGNFQVASQRSNGSCTITLISLLRKGDRVLVGTANQFTSGGIDSATVSAADGTGTITLQGLTRAHAAGEFIVLAMPAARIMVRAGTSNANEIYLGEDSTVGIASATLIDIVDPSGRTYALGDSAIGNVNDTQHYWITGTAADTYLSSLLTV